MNSREMERKYLGLAMVATLVFSIGIASIPIAHASPATLYVDDDGMADATGCDGSTAAYSTIQAAINVANPGDTITVCPGTYDPVVEVTPPCWGGHYYAQAIVVWKNGLIIQAVDPNPANTVIQNTFQGWMDYWRIQKLTGGAYGTPPNCFPLTGGYNPGTSVAPSAIMIVSDDVTIEGFTISSTYIGDPGQTSHPNTAGVFVGGVAAGDTVADGVDGTTIRNNVISGWSAIYNWKSSNTLVEGNTMTNIPPTTAPPGSAVNVWDGWNQGSCSNTSYGMNITDNIVNTVVDTAITFGGMCNNAAVDHSNLYIDQNTINSVGHGVSLWNSVGTNKVMTCNNTVNVPGGYQKVIVSASTYDGPFNLPSVPASVDTATGTGTATFTPVGLTGCRIQDLAASVRAVPPTWLFPHGFFSFKIRCVPVGGTVTVELTLPSAMPPSTRYYKYRNGWVDVTSSLGDNDGDNILTLTLVDGDPVLDDDGLANGEVTDEGGPMIRTMPVGGHITQVDHLQLLTPWLGIVGVIAATATFLVVRGKSKT